MTCCKPIFISTLLWVLAESAVAASPVQDAAQAAMGGAAAASFDDNVSMTVNPSLVALHERYDMGLHGRYGYDGANEWGASVVDARTSEVIGLGLLYRGNKTHPALRTSELPGWTLPGVTPTNVKRRHDIVAALGLNMFSRRVALGVSGSFLFYQHDRLGQGTTGNLDAGLSGHVTKWLVAGASARNVLPISDAGDLPLSVTGGANLYGQAGILRADLEWQDDAGVPWTASAGVQRMIGEVPALRAGYRYSGPDGGIHRVTAGLGLIGPDGSFDLGAMLPVANGPLAVRDTALVASIHLGAPTMDDPL